MSYTDADVGFNGFMERSIATAPANTANELPDNTGNRLDLDQVQVSGSLANVLQLGGQIKGGTLSGGTMSGGTFTGGQVVDSTTRDGFLKNLDLTGQLRVKDKIIVGNEAFVIDGNLVQLIVKDETGTERILIGRLVGGF